MYGTAKQLLKGVMTEKEISETYERLNAIGAEGSKARQCVFDLMRLSESLRQATIQNQEFYYETSNLEQFCYQLHAIKKTYDLTSERVEAGLKMLQEKGFLEQSFIIPDLDTIKAKARQMVHERRIKSEQARIESENGKKGKKRTDQVNWDA